MSIIAVFIGRLFIAVIFIVSGVNKLIHVNDTTAAISAAGLPGALAIPVGLFELIAGVCIALGIAVRLWSILLAGFVLATILFFHREFTDPVQAMAAMKNLAIAGGLLSLFGYGHTRWSHDAMRQRRRDVAHGPHRCCLTPNCAPRAPRAAPTWPAKPSSSKNALLAPLDRHPLGIPPLLR